MSLRVASLEYLGIVAARLRKDAVSSHMDQETINDIVDKARLHYIFCDDHLSYSTLLFGLTVFINWIVFILFILKAFNNSF